MGEKINMSNNKVVAFSLPENNNPVINGTVTEVSDDSATVDISGTRVKAKKAFSCFADPAPADTVICCRDEYSRFFILAIMERKSNKQIRITYPSDTLIQSPEGNIRISSSKSVTMESGSLNFFSRQTAYKSRSASVSFDDVTATGNNLQARYKSVRLISDFINTLAKQVIDRFKGYTRKTEDTEQVEAGRATKKVKGSYSVETRHTIMVSKESTKIDGRKILMG